MNLDEVYRGRTVLVTGHTGFKGSWLCEWLRLLGARVVGYSLAEPPSQPCLFDELGLADRLDAHLAGDVGRLDSVRQVVDRYRPDFLFHLAAQPLVRRAFDEPRATFETNAMGTLHVLEALRASPKDCIAILVTTDKVYENREWLYAYRENDPLGGYDPYSASKACAELIISSYRRSFFQAWLDRPSEPALAVASARGGNVIGGGDWAEDRIVPDCVRSLAGNRPIPVRNRLATRPWQHVLELLGGYLHLGAEIARALEPERDPERLRELCGAFNFGPRLESNRSVGDLVEEILRHWPGDWQDFTEPDAKHEAGRLNLTVDKAHHTLGWEPRWTFEQAVERTVGWYRDYYQDGGADPERLRERVRRQIADYSAR